MYVPGDLIKTFYLDRVDDEGTWTPGLVLGVKRVNGMYNGVHLDYFIMFNERIEWVPDIYVRGIDSNT